MELLAAEEELRALRSNKARGWRPSKARPSHIPVDYSGEFRPIDQINGAREVEVDLAKAEKDLADCEMQQAGVLDGEEGVRANALMGVLTAREEVAGQRLRVASASESAFDRSLVTAFWRASAALLFEYDNQRAAGLEPNYPAAAIRRIAKIAERIATGNLPRIVVDASLDAGRPLWPDERRHIAIAVFYMIADRVLVPDRNSAKTVASCFGISERTAYRWKAKADEICFGILRPRPEVLAKRMREAGGVYSRIGRGTGNDSETADQD